MASMLSLLERKHIEARVWCNQPVPSLLHIVCSCLSRCIFICVSMRYDLKPTLTDVLQACRLVVQIKMGLGYLDQGVHTSSSSIITED